MLTISIYISNHCESVWSVIHVSPPPLMQETEKIHFLVSLPTLSNQDRELHKEVALSANEHAESRILLFATKL